MRTGKEDQGMNAFCGAILAAAFAAATVAGAGVVRAGEANDTAATAHQQDQGSKGAWDQTKDAAKAAGQTIENAAKTTGHAIKEGAVAAGGAVKNAVKASTDAIGITEADKVAYNRNKIADHEMSGRVTNIDREDGRITVDTDEATLGLFFPTDTVDQLEQGQNVTVELALAKLPVKRPLQEQTENTASADQQAKNERAYDAPQDRMYENSQHWTTGTIKTIDHDKGTMQVDTGADQTLNVHFPPQYTKDLDAGERVAVELALVPMAAQLGSHPGSKQQTTTEE
jgi:hypothetical protein